MKLTTRLVVPAAVAGALAVGAAAIAWADSSPSPSPSRSSGPGDAKHSRAGGIERRALHGELTVPQRGQGRDQTGTVQTEVVDTQRGEISAINKLAKTLTVKSRDGFTRTYVVTANTKIRSKGTDESFNDLSVGERAMVLSQHEGSKYVAQVIRCVHEPNATSAAS
jgi:hypothetical protein